MSIGIKDITFKLSLLSTDRDLNQQVIKSLEQQQAEIGCLTSLLTKIHVDLIKRAELRGDVYVGLSDGIWMALCDLIEQN